MKIKQTTLVAALLLIGATSCRDWQDYLGDHKPPREPKVTDYATGLRAPVGLELTANGYVWVTEAGTGNNDGKVSVITSEGRIYPVIECFVSAIDPEGNPSGVNHLVEKNGVLWILNGVDGKLYKLDVSSFIPGDKPWNASKLEYEDIAEFVKKAGYEESNPYNLTFGPNDDLYITDAAANAVLRRRAESGELSVFATFPDIPNPTPVGPPTINAVPTGIVYTGHEFLVTGLLGFPFLPEKTNIYKVSLDGKVSVYQDGLTSLVDIELGWDHRPVVLQFAQWTETGWAPKSGQIVQATKEKVTPLLDKLNTPTDIERGDHQTWFVTSLADGKVLRVVF